VINSLRLQGVSGKPSTNIIEVKTTPGRQRASKNSSTTIKALESVNATTTI